MNNIFIVYYLLNNVWTNITSLCDLPFLNKKALDETLNQASLNLTFTNIAEPFVPLTKFKIVIEDTVAETTETLYKVLDRDLVTRETNSLYTHSLYLIEPTKVLERSILGGKAFTNRITQKITPTYEQADGVGEPFKTEYNELILENYITPLVLDSNILIKNIKPLATISKFLVGQWVPDPVIITINKPDGTTVSVNEGGSYLIDQLSSDYSDTPYDIIYTLNYTFGSFLGVISYGTEVWTYTAISQTAEDIASQRLTIGKCITKLLKSKQALKVDNTNEVIEYGVANTVAKMSQQYYFDDEWFAKFDKVLAPEILIPNKTTLWEALVQILNNVQALPRLTANLTDDKKFDRIICDDLSGKEEFTTAIEVTAETSDYSSDMYATSLDVTVDNILNTNDTEQGSIVEPYGTGYKTTRAEDTRIVISDDTAIITTERPIYRILKVEMGFINEDDKMEDITRYVYEKTEYDRLTSVTATYPNSKAYALYYEMGGTQIQGLSFKNEPDAANILGLVDPAIYNIIKYVYPSETVPSYKNLGFRITYIPEDTMRIESLHPDFLFLLNTGSETASALVENQTENIVDSEEMGNKLKGIVSRLSNPQKTITTFVEDNAELPEIGMKYGDYYVTSVTREMHDNYIQATIGLSKNFNRISEYVGLESERRFYQVSERQSLDRMINIPLVVTVGRADFNYVPEITDTGINCIRDLFVGDYDYTQATSLISTTKEEYADEVAKEIAKTLHSVSSLSAGNSLVFNFKYKDNYSAGFKALDYDVTPFAKATQEYVPYGNSYGNFKLIDISISESINEQDTFTKQKDLGKAYPSIPAGYTITPVNNYLNLTDYWVDKDSREALNATIQVHFIANEREVIIGNGLAKFNNMVFNGERQLIMVLLDRQLSVIDKFIDIENQITIDMPDIGTISSIGDYRRFKIESQLIPELENEPTFKAWAIIDNQTSELIIGRNEEITADGSESTTATYFNF